jgi:hypothetical protein
MTADPHDIRTWIHAPEGWMIIVLITFFACTTIFNWVIFPLMLPVERVEQQMHSDPAVTGFAPEGVKYLCDANGFSLIGFKFRLNVASQSRVDHVQGLACWNFDNGDWDIKLSQPRR